MSKQIHLVVLWVYDPERSRILNGGMERWCRDVAHLARKKGYDVTVYQKATEAFEAEIGGGVRIVGVPSKPTFRGNLAMAKWLERNVGTQEPFVFVSQEIAISRRIRRSVAVNHGIWWDGDFPVWKKWLNKRIQHGLIRRTRATICVDTNYINWCHSELPNRELWQHKLHYIPNYADLEKFAVCRHVPKSTESPTILFPRRVNGVDLRRDGRGAGLLLRALETLETAGFHAKVVFAGRGKLQEAIERWAAERGMADRVEVTEVPLDDMPQLYARADVVVVPSLEHEGTSLSAIEGLVSGKSVVVSHIGGLGNIIIDGLNGHICDLTPESLAKAIRLAAKRKPSEDDPAVLEACRRSLGKERWDRQVWSVLEESLGL